MKYKGAKKNRIIRVLITDNNSIFREGLRFLIQNQPDMEVIGEAGDGRTTLHMIPQLSFDIFIVDSDLPDMDSLDIIGQIAARFPGVKIIALVTHPSREFVSEIFKAGASGFLLRNCHCDDVERAIRTVVSNRISLSPERIDNYMRIISGVAIDE